MHPKKTPLQNFDDLSDQILHSMIQYNPQLFDQLKNPSQSLIFGLLNDRAMIPWENVNRLDIEHQDILLRHRRSIIVFIKNPTDEQIAGSFKWLEYGELAEFENTDVIRRAIRNHPDFLFRIKNCFFVLDEDLIEEIYERIEVEISALMVFNTTQRDDIKTYLKIKFG